MEVLSLNNYIEVIEYKNINNSFSNIDIHDFINKCMHQFISRPYKQRLDVLNIEDYYLKNEGNFWVAIDKRKEIIVGTIALKNKEKYGIVKRLYVKEEYQHLGVGTMLYKNLEKYAINNTEIKNLYLACGKILRNAHNFYRKSEFKEIEYPNGILDFSFEDDYFEKVIK